jgi:pyruvate dehydrogenase E2 component (dihydrolipoamide acetyltransferase)
MLREFQFPDIGEGIEEGRIVRWYVKEGDVVEEHQVVGEVETDKAIAEIPSPYAGKIVKINFREGDAVKVGEALFVIDDGRGADTEQGSKTIAEHGTNAEHSLKPAGAVGYLEEATEVEQPRILATPAVRKLAKDFGVDLTKIKGTGPGGRITEDDVKKFSTFSAKRDVLRAKRKYDMWGYIDYVPLSGIRKSVAKHMVESVTSAPQVTVMDEMDATFLVKIRSEKLKEAEKQNIKLTYLPFIMKALVRAMEEYPMVNATLEGETQEVIVKKYYNFGVAVDVDGQGLMVPVVKGVDQKDIFQIAKEITELAAKARARKIDLQDLRGGTFTITNFGSLGSWFATPILNYPEVAILGLGRMREKPIAENGKVIIKPVMPLSLTFDHRVLDGAYAIRFLNKLMEHLQKPEG